MEYKAVDNTSGMYFIYEDGKLFSKYSNRFLKQNKQASGYTSYTIKFDDGLKLKLTHRLVAEYFIPNPEEKPFINHINGIKDDNRVENLEWVTPSENIQHAYDIGLSFVPKGKEHHLYGKKPHNKGIDNRSLKKCIWCNSEYKTYNKESVFCSRTCRNKNRYKDKKKYTMREIIFRGKRIDNNEWVYGYLLSCREKELFYITEGIGANGIEVILETIGQFTNLTDKNGKKLFEGDVLKESRLNGLEFYYKVFYKKGGLVINTHQDDFNKPTEHIFFYESIADMQNSGFIETLEIIGNIHDNL